MLRYFLLIFSCWLSQSLTAAEVCKASYDVVPLPRSIAVLTAPSFMLGEETSIVCLSGDALQERNSRFLQEYVEDLTSLRLPVRMVAARELKKARKGNIVLAIDDKIKGKEAYRINISDKGIVISGGTAAGVFYAIQTLRKSLPLAQTKQIEMPAVLINDEPRFGYRGMHFDSARHFFGVDFVKQYIDMMALHGMNRFHWHLTDDQGWRIEIKKYPRLAEVGSVRQQTVIGRNMDIYDETPHGGYYTQQQLRDIVAYAAERYITVIPEIDMPGHMIAALTAYPELGCTGGPYQVMQYWGVFPDILCAGQEQTFRFVEDVLDEVCDIFPSTLIHIGGDEAPYDRWKNCPRCQQRIVQEGITAANDQSAEARLQGYFTTRVQHYLKGKGRRIIGWDELLDCNVDTTATIMSWRGAEPGAKAATMHHDVIMTPNSYMYFDYYQSDRRFSEPLLIGGNVPIEKTYSFEPLAESLSESDRHHIMGVQANLWTEYIAWPHLAEYQVLPRMGALAEVQWMMPQAKDFQSFRQRALHMRDLYRHHGWDFCPFLWQ